MDLYGCYADYYKVGNAEIMLAQIKPIKLPIFYKSEIVSSTNWMDFYIWQEVNDLIGEIIKEYEYNSIELSKCEIQRKKGSHVKLGYQFIKYGKCSSTCRFLLPLHYTCNNWDEKMRNKGSNFVKCMETPYFLLVTVYPLYQFKSSPCDISNLIQWDLNYSPQTQSSGNSGLFNYSNNYLNSYLTLEADIKKEPIKNIRQRSSIFKCINQNKENIGDTSSDTDGTTDESHSSRPLIPSISSTNSDEIFNIAFNCDEYVTSDLSHTSEHQNENVLTAESQEFCTTSSLRNSSSKESIYFPKSTSQSTEQTDFLKDLKYTLRSSSEETGRSKSPVLSSKRIPKLSYKTFNKSVKSCGDKDINDFDFKKCSQKESKEKLKKSCSRTSKNEIKRKVTKLKDESNVSHSKESKIINKKRASPSSIKKKSDTYSLKNNNLDLWLNESQDCLPDIGASSMVQNLITEINHVAFKKDKNISKSKPVKRTKKEPHTNSQFKTSRSKENTKILKNPSKKRTKGGDNKPRIDSKYKKSTRKVKDIDKDLTNLKCHGSDTSENFVSNCICERENQINSSPASSSPTLSEDFSHVRRSSILRSVLGNTTWLSQRLSIDELPLTNDTEEIEFDTGVYEKVFLAKVKETFNNLSDEELKVYFEESRQYLIEVIKGSIKNERRTEMLRGPNFKRNYSCDIFYSLFDRDEVYEFLTDTMVDSLETIIKKASPDLTADIYTMTILIPELLKEILKSFSFVKDRGISTDEQCELLFEELTVKCPDKIKIKV